jgi:hypothetical protein
VIGKPAPTIICQQFVNRIINSGAGWVIFQNMAAARGDLFLASISADLGVVPRVDAGNLAQLQNIYPQTLLIPA